MSQLHDQLVGVAGFRQMLAAAEAGPVKLTSTFCTPLSPSAEVGMNPLIPPAISVWQPRSIAAHGKALAEVSARLEPELGKGVLRVAIVWGDDGDSDGIGSSFRDALVLNGMSAEANIEAGNLWAYEMADENVDYATAAIVERAPDLVVVALADPTVLVEAVEASLAPPLAWLISLRSSGGEDLSAGLEDRLFAVRTGAPFETALLDQLAVRYASRFGEAPPFAAVEAYDAAYVAIHALALAGADAATGAMLSEAIPYLVTAGVAVAVGPGDLNAGFAALAVEGGGIDLQGTTGSLDADLTTGSFPRSIEVLCTSGADLVPSGLVVGENGALQGASSCL